MLTFIRRTTRPGSRMHRAKYRCHCGAEIVALIGYVNSGRKTSCGCDAPPRKTGAFIYDFEGERLTIRQIIARTGSELLPGTVIARLKAGVPMAVALTMSKHEMLRRSRNKSAGQQGARIDYRAATVKVCPGARIDTYFDDGGMRSWRVFSPSGAVLGRGRTRRYAWQSAWLGINKERRAA